MAKNNIKLPNGLCEKILQRIREEQIFFVIRKIIVFSGILILALICFIPAINLVLSDVKQSGFFYFFSLLFLDFSFVMAYWKNFAMALLQTLPAISLAIFFGVLVTFLQSIRSLSKNIKNIKKYAK